MSGDMNTVIIDCEAREIMHLVASVRPSVCNALLVEPFDLKVFVCVSVISGRMRIIAQMRSIGVLI